MSEHCAVPLCLPNNCKWDEQTGEYSKDEDQDRNSLYVINAALERLRAIEGMTTGGPSELFEASRHVIPYIYCIS